MRWLIGLGLVLVGLLVTPASALADCTCPKLIVQGGWCDDCKLGHVKTVASRDLKGDVIAAAKSDPIKCRDCYEARTAAIGGFCVTHSIGYLDGAKVKCQTCVAAAHGANDSWCDACGMGHAAGRSTKCKECLSALEKDNGGWCDKCETGYVGGNDTKCKSCYDAMKSDKGAWCEKCGLGYGQGHETKCKECFANMQLEHGGWCGKCETGYAEGAQTWCQSCFEAIQKDGRCTKCEVTFKDGSVVRALELHVSGLADNDAADKIKDALKDLPGTSDVKIDKDTGIVTLKIRESGKANAHDAYVAVRRCGCEVRTTKTS